MNDNNRKEITNNFKEVSGDLAESWRFLSSSAAIAPIVMVGTWIAVIAAVLLY
jgi:hypothetical protein